MSCACAKSHFSFRFALWNTVQTRKSVCGVFALDMISVPRACSYLTSSSDIESRLVIHSSNSTSSLSIPYDLLFQNRPVLLEQFRLPSLGVRWSELPAFIIWTMLLAMTGDLTVLYAKPETLLQSFSGRVRINRKGHQQLHLEQVNGLFYNDPPLH